MQVIYKSKRDGSDYQEEWLDI